MRALKAPYLLRVLSMLSWAGYWLLARALRADIPPIGRTFRRWALALATVVPSVAPGTRGKATRDTVTRKRPVPHPAPADDAPGPLRRQPTRLPALRV